MRFCFGAIANVLYLCKKHGITQPQLITALYRCFIPHYTEVDSGAAKKCLDCTRNVPPDVVQAARNVGFEDIYKRFNAKISPLLNRNKDSIVILALRDILEKDKIGMDVEVGDITKSKLLEKTEFCFEEFLTKMLIYTVDCVKNTDGKGYANAITITYIDDFEEREGEITLIKRGGDYNISRETATGLTPTEKEIARLNAIFDKLGDKRPQKIEPPCKVTLIEKPYISAILEAFSEKENSSINEDTLSNYPNHLQSFLRYREDYFNAVSIKEFTRDLFANEEKDDFESLCDEIFNGIIDVYESEHKDGLARLRAVLSQSSVVITSKCILSRRTDFIGTSEKKGVCHVLVCDGRIKGWVFRDDF